ncbi:response regulator [Dyadobacter sp. CY312]|uniref:response regulator n=1 Tax=Dyadobacter sp. CY312 TaxID=2907303 RepID=UPI001F20AE07|nr:response regulator [Dyadobacter sp. CY312]MCE7042866.1 response regulator [Dyadobacter sp. CY312]
MTREIFVVDDNADFQFIFFKLLKELKRPYAVTFFENAKACHQHMLTLQLKNAPVRPSLILTDLHMPGMNGLQLLRMLKSSLPANDTSVYEPAVVVMSSYMPDGQVLQCYEAGADAVIMKPADFALLKMTVESICNFWLERKI